jgi:hypothetical protein
VLVVDNGVGARLAVEYCLGQSFYGNHFEVFTAVFVVGKYGGFGKVGDWIRCFLFITSCLAAIAWGKAFHGYRDTTAQGDTTISTFSISEHFNEVKCCLIP